eukprot:3922296-Amphidinium_carterae.1
MLLVARQAVVVGVTHKRKGSQCSTRGPVTQDGRGLVVETGKIRKHGRTVIENQKWSGAVDHQGDRVLDIGGLKLKSDYHMRL